MGLCKTSNVFTVINASDLKFCPRSYSSCVYRMMRFRGSNENICKMMTSHFRTLLVVVDVRCVCLFSLQQYLIFLSSRHSVDDQSPVIRKRGEDPRVSTRPLHRVHTVFMFIIGSNHAVHTRLLGPGNQISSVNCQTMNGVISPIIPSAPQSSSRHLIFHRKALVYTGDLKSPRNRH